MVKTKYVKISSTQQEILLSYMEAHPEFSRGQPQGLLGRANDDKTWEALAVRLNVDQFGATKNATKWKTTWTDWKAKTKSKALAIRKYETGSGRGEPTNSKLTDMEIRLMLLCGWEMSFDEIVQEGGFAPDASEDQPTEEYYAEENENSVVDVDEDVMVVVADAVIESDTEAGETQSHNLQRQLKSRSSKHGAKKNTHYNITTSPYVRATTSLGSIDEERLPLQKKLCDLAAEIAKSAKTMSDAFQLQAAATDRLAAAAERKATASERKATAAERKAAALERIALSKEIKSVGNLREKFDGPVADRGGGGPQR